MQYIIYFPAVALLALMAYLVVEYQTRKMNPPTSNSKEEDVVPPTKEEPQVEQPKPVKKKPGRPKKKVAKKL